MSRMTYFQVHRRVVPNSQIPPSGILAREGLSGAVGRRVSVLEVSQTGDRVRFEEIQSLAITARVGGFVD